MKLIAYVTDGRPPAIRPAPVERDWMNLTSNRHPYRCLPLNIANCHGWELLCPSAFAAVWHGGMDTDAVKVRSAGDTAAPANSHFGQAVLTFHTSCLFRTEPGYDLMVQGPVNRPKDGIAPLTGIVETDWVPFTFTMNWLFTRPGVLVRFEEAEPFCHIFPVKRGEIETVEPETRMLADDPELEQQYRAWTASRSQFNKDLKRPGSDAKAAGWQKRYQRGLDAEDRPVAELHRTRIKLKPFVAR
jgi:hypothetical protein